MPRPDDASYHRHRALRELDVGLTAQDPSVARAHMELSSLHLRRAQELGADVTKPLLEM